MTTRRALTAVILAVLLLAACSDDTSVQAGSSTTTTSSPSDGGHGDGAGTVPARPADITGTITSVAPFEPITEDCTPPEDLDPDGVHSSDDPPVCTGDDENTVGTVLVEEQTGVDEGRKISFTVTTDTVLTGAGLANFGDLAEGQEVEAWATGACAESYPEQCTAKAIRLIG